MKIYVHEKGVIFVGKAWEIREKLKAYQKSYAYVSEWVADTVDLSSGNGRALNNEKPKK